MSLPFKKARCSIWKATGLPSTNALKPTKLTGSSVSVPIAEPQNAAVSMSGSGNATSVFTSLFVSLVKTKRMRTSLGLMARSSLAMRTGVVLVKTTPPAPSAAENHTACEGAATTTPPPKPSAASLPPNLWGRSILALTPRRIRGYAKFRSTSATDLRISAMAASISIFWRSRTAMRSSNLCLTCVSCLTVPFLS